MKEESLENLQYDKAIEVKRDHPDKPYLYTLTGKKLAIYEVRVEGATTHLLRVSKRKERQLATQAPQEIVDARKPKKVTEEYLRELEIWANEELLIPEGYEVSLRMAKSKERAMYPILYLSRVFDNNHQMGMATSPEGKNVKLNYCLRGDKTEWLKIAQEMVDFAYKKIQAKVPKVKEVKETFTNGEANMIVETTRGRVLSASGKVEDVMNLMQKHRERIKLTLGEN